MSWLRLMVDLRNQVWWACNAQVQAPMSKGDRENAEENMQNMRVGRGEAPEVNSPPLCGDG